MSEQCNNCRFWLASTTEHEPVKTAGGVCRRNAPIGPSFPTGYGWSAFPPMPEWHWCGDYRPAADAVAIQQRAVA